MTSASSSGPEETSSETTDDPSSTSGGPDPVVPIVIQNPGFEADNVAPGTYNDKIVPAGWTMYDPANLLPAPTNSLGVLNPTGTVLYPDGAPEGTNVALVFLWHGAPNDMPAGYIQVLGDTLQANTEYTLRVKVGNIAPEDNAPWDLSGFPGYRVELLAGGVVLAADNDTLLPAEGMFLQSEVSFTTTDDDAMLEMPLAIRLLNLDKMGVGIEVNFDDVELFAAPSP